MTSGRQALPGGAPLPGKKLRACKYGPRIAGKCPKAPRKSSFTAPTAPRSSGSPKSSSKRACKYGPRGADGYCPKKPRAPKKPVPDNFLDKPRNQGVTPAGNPRTTTVRKEVNKVIDGTTTAVTREVVTKAITAYKKDPQRFKETLKNLARELAVVSLISAAAYGVFRAASGAAAAKQDIINRLIFDALTKTKTDLLRRGIWKQEYFNPLVDQYREYFTKEVTRAQHLRK